MKSAYPEVERTVTQSRTARARVFLDQLATSGLIPAITILFLEVALAVALWINYA